MARSTANQFSHLCKSKGSIEKLLVCEYALEHVVPFSSRNFLKDENAHEDKLALLAFKNSITRDPNGALSSWNDSLHHCSWPGVTCFDQYEDDYGRLTILNLGRNSLMGEIPSYLFNCSSLIGLDISGNKLSGEIPQQISYFSRLTLLMLNNNAFTGTIPSNLSK
ncbi:hypothetical protein LguiB_000720 [Lonicera macranthoides]